MIKNTGKVQYATLQEYNLQTGAPTGNTRPNVPTDPYYIPPHIDLEACPVDPQIEQDISTIQVRAMNQSSRFVNFDIFQVRPDNSEVAYQGPFRKGPGQFDEGSPKRLLGGFLNIKAHLVAASNGLPVKLQLKWTDDTLLRESINVFPNQTWEIQGVGIPYEPLHKQEKVKMIVIDGYVPPTTTTTTTSSTTTTTTTSSTTTTTTLKPTNTLLIYIEEKSRIQVEEIRFYDSNHNIIFQYNTLITEGTTPINCPIGTYKIALKIFNSPSTGYISQLNNAESQQVIGDGIYAFENVNLDQGAIISFKQGTSTNIRAYGDFVAEGDLSETFEPVLPNGMIKDQVREFTFELLLGGAPPVPQTINNIYYRVDYIESGQTTYDHKVGSLNNDTRVVLETIQHRDIYDYNQDPVNPIISIDYSYVLFPGFEYVLPY